MSVMNLTFNLILGEAVCMLCVIALTRKQFFYFFSWIVSTIKFYYIIYLHQILLKFLFFKHVNYVSNFFATTKYSFCSNRRFRMKGVHRPRRSWTTIRSSSRTSPSLCAKVICWKIRNLVENLGSIGKLRIYKKKFLNLQ